MLKSNTDNNIKSEQKFTRQVQVQNHQEIVFGDSKFIFYDSNILEPTLKKIKSDNRTSIYKKIGPTKPNTQSIRPITTIAKQRSKIMTTKLKNKEKSFKAKDNCKINLVFNEQPGQVKPNEAANQDQLRNSLRLSKNIQNRPSSRVSNKYKTAIPNLNLNSSDKSSKFKSSSNLQKSRSKNQQTQRTQEKENLSSIAKKEVEQKTSLAQVSKLEAPSQFEKEKEILDFSDEENKNSFNLARHDQIKQIFGLHHKFLKTDRDYLLFKNEDLNRQSEHYSKNKKSKNSLTTQKKLQKQISELKIASNSPGKDNFSRFQTNSLASNTPKSILNTNSFIAQTGIYRAPILLYLKNSETKKLYNIIIQNSRENENQNYVDKEFSHEGISKINEESVEWVYIQPNVNVKMFPVDQEIRLICSEEDSQEKTQYLEFVTFLKCLYYVEPDLIKRLFEPPVNNLYSVWLFLNGCYEPVFVDGYFPLDSHLNHLYGSFGQFLWLPILVKSLCKVKNSLSKDKLSHLKLSEIYCMLTGMPLQIIQNQQFSKMPCSQLSKLICKQAESGYSCILHFPKSQSIWLAFCDDNIKVTLLDVNTGEREPLQSFQKTNFSIIVIPELTNQFIYNFRANESSLSKFQVICPKSTQITFSIGGVSGQKTKNRRLYIYECEQFGKNNGKIKLVLREEAEIKHIKKFKLKKGNYKVFVEDGQKKIHLLLTGKNIVKWQQKSAICSQFCISLFATHEVKLSQIEQLQKKGNYLEDSSNIYQDCPNKRSQQHE